LVGQDHAFIESSQILLQLPADSDHSNVSVTVVALAPNGASIAIGASDGTVRILPIAEGSAPTMIAKLEYSVEVVAFSPDAKLVASGPGRSIVTAIDAPVESPALECLQRFNGGDCVVFSPDGNSLAFGRYRDGITVLDIKTGENRFAINPFAGAGPVDTGLYKPSTEALTFSPDGKLLAVTSYFYDDELPAFRDIQVCDAMTGKIKFFLRGRASEFSPDGKLLAYRSGAYYDGDGRIVLLDLETFLPAGVLTGCFHHGHFSPDGRTMAAISKSDLEVWSIAPPQPGRSYYACKRIAILRNDSDFTSFAFFPDGHSIVTGDKQGAVRKWRIDAWWRANNSAGGRNICDSPG